MPPPPPPTPILLVAEGLDPVGIGRQLELVATGLAAAGRDVRVALTSRDRGLTARLEAAGVPVHAVGRRPGHDPLAALRLAAVVRRVRPRVLVGWERHGLAGAALATRFARGVPLVGYAATPPSSGWPWRAAARLVVASTELEESHRRGGAAGRLHVVAPGIIADPGGGLSREELATRLGLDPAAEWTLCVAPLEANSRLERLLWGIDQLGVVRRGIQHVLVGRGPQLTRLRRRAFVQRLGERLFVRPRCDLLPDLLGQVRLVWQSGRVPLGGAILDGMARGVPAVAVDDVTVRPLVVDGSTGHVVPAMPESELPRRAFQILEDAAHAARCAAAARDRAAGEFPVARMVAAFASVIDGIG